jgi:hypothetical protein
MRSSRESDRARWLIESPNIYEGTGVMPSSFEADFPEITRWIKEFGRIEIGGASFADPFVKAVNRDGIRWSGKREYTSIDEALKDMECGIEGVLVEQAKTSPSRTRKIPRRKPLKTKHRADKHQHRSDEEKKAGKRVEQLEAIAEQLRRGGDFPVTRLTILKGLCEDRKAAGAFAVFLARKIQRRMREKKAPKRYLELVNRAVREMKPYQEQPTDEWNERLWAVWHEMKEEQSEYRPISWGMLRIIKSMDLLVAEKCVESVLRPDQASHWLYQAARDYAERYDARHPNGLTRKSAPLVEEIAMFWRKYLGLSRRG